jgi:hypothetical protein
MTIYHEAGKGSAPRQQSNQQQYEKNWDAIFDKKTLPPADDKVQPPTPTQSAMKSCMLVKDATIE